MQTRRSSTSRRGSSPGRAQSPSRPSSPSSAAAAATAAPSPAAGGRVTSARRRSTAASKDNVVSAQDKELKTASKTQSIATSSGVAGISGSAAEDVASSDEEDKEEETAAAAPAPRAAATETMGGRPLAEPTANDPASMKKKIVTRTVIALMMIAFYMIMITAGHLYCILVAMAVQIELFRELVNARYVGAKGRDMPLFRTLQWSWFVLAMFYSYGDNLHSFCLTHRHLHYVTAVTAYLDAIVYAGYCALFIATVLTFKKGMIRFQLSHLMWTLVTVLLVVVQLKSLATTAFAGLFWFFFPMATVVMNDVSAYFCGITCGRKFISAPFLSLSPNKTWEGFIGAAVLTVIFSFFFPLLLAQFQWFTCPTDDLYLMPYAQLTKLACTPNAVFLPQQYTLPTCIQALVSTSTITLLPIQLHGIAYGLFASLVAPFGGFFASAVKRGYGIKDFETLFPGHGGVMDRMDCQLLMLSFTWVHYETFIVQKTLSVARIVAALAALSHDEKKAVLAELQRLISA